MRVVITGAGGFVGPHVRRALESAGHEVASAVGPHGNPALGTPVDLTDPRAAEAVICPFRPEAVVHLAARLRPGDLEQHGTLLDNNARCATNVLAAVHREAPAARVLVVSSSAVYGHVAVERNPVREDEPLRPVLPYGVSKVAVEVIAGAYGALGLDVVTVRPFNLAGPGQSENYVPASFASQVARILSGAATPAVETGSLGDVRDFTDVRDAARACVMLLQAGVGPGPFNVCSGVPRRVGDVLTELLALAGVRAEVRFRPVDSVAAPLDIPYQCGDGKALERAIGWRPEIAWQHTLEDALRDWCARLSQGESA